MPSNAGRPTISQIRSALCAATRIVSRHDFAVLSNAIMTTYFVLLYLIIYRPSWPKLLLSGHFHPNFEILGSKVGDERIVNTEDRTSFLGGRGVRETSDESFNRKITERERET